MCGLGYTKLARFITLHNRSVNEIKKNIHKLIFDIISNVRNQNFDKFKTRLLFFTKIKKKNRQYSKKDIKLLEKFFAKIRGTNSSLGTILKSDCQKKLDF